MYVRNLVSWAGPNWEYEPGDIIELDRPTAKERIRAGLAEKVAAPAQQPQPDAQEGNQP